jgi:hypothetical protein
MLQSNYHIGIPALLEEFKIDIEGCLTNPVQLIFLEFEGIALKSFSLFANGSVDVKFPKIKLKEMINLKSLTLRGSSVFPMDSFYVLPQSLETLVIENIRPHSDFLHKLPLGIKYLGVNYHVSFDTSLAATSFSKETSWISRLASLETFSYKPHSHGSYRSIRPRDRPKVIHFDYKSVLPSSVHTLEFPELKSASAGYDLPEKIRGLNLKKIIFQERVTLVSEINFLSHCWQQFSTNCPTSFLFGLNEYTGLLSQP